MKSRIVYIVPILLILFLASSCREYYKITSKVNADGSILRTIQVKGDSSSIFKGDIFVPQDSSWNTTIEWEYKNPDDTTSDRQIIYTATKLFSSSEELNKFLAIDPDTCELAEITCSFKKKFRWFYTYIFYSETFKKKMPLDHYPIEDFMNDIELNLLCQDDFTYNRELDSLISIQELESLPNLSHEDSLRMDELEYELISKFMNWQARNIFEEFYLLLKDVLEDIDQEKVAFLVNNKEQLYQDSNLEQTLVLDMGDDVEPLDTIALNFGLTEDSLKILVPEKYELFENKIETIFDFYDSDRVYNQISMPGMLINSNADSVSGNNSFWKSDENRFYAKDFELVAESRLVNKWAFWVIGILSLMLLFFLVQGLFKR